MLINWQLSRQRVSPLNDHPPTQQPKNEQIGRGVTNEEELDSPSGTVQSTGNSSLDVNGHNLMYSNPTSTYEE